MVIDFDSIPVYNYSTVANAIGVSGSSAIFTDKLRNEPVWTCADWITFFNKLNSKYGEAKAKEQWGYWWNLGSSSGSGGAGDIRAGSGVLYDSVPEDCKTLDSDFRKFLDKYKLSDVVFKGLGKIAKPIGIITDVASTISDTLGMTSKVLKYGIPILVGAVIIMAGFWVYHKTES